MTIEYTIIADRLTIFLKNVKINLNYAWEIKRALLGEKNKVIVLGEEEDKIKSKSITIDPDSLITFAWYNNFPWKAFTDGDICLDKVGIIFPVDNDLETFKKSPLKALSTCKMLPYLKKSPPPVCELGRVQVVDDTGGILSKFSGIVFSSNRLIDYEN